MSDEKENAGDIAEGINRDRFIGGSILGVIALVGVCAIGLNHFGDGYSFERTADVVAPVVVTEFEAEALAAIPVIVQATRELVNTELEAHQREAVTTAIEASDDILAGYDRALNNAIGVRDSRCVIIAPSESIELEARAAVEGCGWRVLDVMEGCYYSNEMLGTDIEWFDCRNL